MNNILHRTANRSLPTSSPLAALPQLFATYSLIKSQSFISTYKPTPLPPQLVLSHLHPSSTPHFHSCHLTCYRQSTLSIIWFILWSRSCSNHDTREISNAISPTNLSIVNLSITTGTFPSTLKSSIISPLLKKPSLNKEDLFNYLTIANFFFISKLFQKAPSRPFNFQLFAQPLSICLYQILLYQDYTTFPTWPSF